MSGSVLRRLRENARWKLQRALGEVVAGHVDEVRRELAALHAEVASGRDQQRAEVDELRSRLLRGLADLEGHQRRDISYAAESRAARETEEFVLANLPTAPSFPDPLDTLRFALEHVRVEGSALEFGVATGTTLGVIVEGLPGREVAGFDVFTGLPEDWRTGFPAGAFQQDALPDVPGAELVVGLFEDTLPGYLDAHPGPVALLHVDSDLYSSAVTVLELVGPRLVVGSVVVFDEYFNYPGWHDGEHRAWTEHLARTGTEVEHLGYTLAHEQLVVRVTAVGPRG